MQLDRPLVLRRAAVPAALVADCPRFGGQLQADCLTGDLVVEAGRVQDFCAPGAALPHHRSFDLGGRIVLPRLVEAHCHLDKCHTVFRLGRVGGDLQAAIAAQGADRVNCTAADIRERAARGLAELETAGCAAVRSHVDWDAANTPAGQAPLAWQVLGELAQEWSGRIRLQRAALLSLDDFDDPDAAEAVAGRIAADGGVLGVFVLDQADKQARLRRVFELAARHQLALDFHVDEGLGEGLDGLVTIARLVSQTGFERPVLCGHACSLMNLADRELERALERILAAGLAVVALPTTNLYLQGRREGTPERRGITRVLELARAGVPLAFGADNVGDAFCPLGRHDPMASLATAALTAHLDPPYGPWLTTVTTDARKAIGLEAQALAGAKAADLLVSDARHTAELVSGTRRRPLEAYLAEQTQAAL